MGPTVWIYNNARNKDITGLFYAFNVFVVVLIRKRFGDVWLLIL